MLKCMVFIQLIEQTKKILLQNIQASEIRDSYFDVNVFIVYLFYSFIIKRAIIITSIKLVVDTYFHDSNPDDSNIIYISKQMDIVFTCFFTVEALLKSLAFGFILDNKSYLREEWSQLDFFIVVSSLIDVSVDSINLSIVKILRLLRTLRPLRFISHNRSMKLIVTALLESVGGIMNVVIVLVLIWLMFAILAINLMKGKLNYCQFPSSYLATQDSIYQIHQTQVQKFLLNIVIYITKKCAQIQGAQWQTYNLNFDNIGSGMLTLFILSTLEGWPDYLWYFIDGDDYGPVKNYNTYFLIYFIVFIFIGSLFLLNLFVAIMSFNYNLASKKSKNQFLTDEQAQWIELQRLLCKSTPDYASLKPPENYFRKQIWNLCESPYLDTFIMTCIILNIVTMAMTFETSSTFYDSILTKINLFFTSVFIFECFLKVIAYGLRGYFFKGWNQFDFFVVMTSIIDIIMSVTGNQFISFLKVGPQIARVFRVLRVSRLFRLIKSFQNLQKLIQTAVYSLPSLLNVAALLFLVYFIFSILAVFLFSSIKNDLHLFYIFYKRGGKWINNDQNFSNFHNSINLLFICSTGENWMNYMFETIQYGSGFNAIFFVFFIIIVQFVMMNLFILIIVDQFEQNYINEDNPLNEFQSFEDNFKKIWVEKTKENHGIKINERFLTDFYLNLQEPYGFDYLIKKKKILDEIKENFKDITTQEIDTKMERFRVMQQQIADKQIMLMNIYCDYEGYIYFNELMFFIQKFALQSKILDLKNEKNRTTVEQVSKFKESQKIIRKEEKLTLKKLAQIKKQQTQVIKQKVMNQRQQGVNPLVRRLFVCMCFKSWRNYNTQIQQKIDKDKLNSDDISSNSDTDDAQEEDLLDALFEFQQVKKNIIPRDHLFQHTQSQNLIAHNQLDNKYIYLPNTDVYKNYYDQDSKKSFIKQQSNHSSVEKRINNPSLKLESNNFIQENS